MWLLMSIWTQDTLQRKTNVLGTTQRWVSRQAHSTAVSWSDLAHQVEYSVRGLTRVPGLLFLARASWTLDIPQPFAVWLVSRARLLSRRVSAHYYRLGTGYSCVAPYCCVLALIWWTSLQGRIPPPTNLSQFRSGGCRTWAQAPDNISLRYRSHFPSCC